MKMSVVEHNLEGGNPKEDFASRIVAAYPGITNLYASIRFKIIHLRFLEEIEQYLPDEGEILDLGCGFGLFAMYMALCKPKAHLIGLDTNGRRLRMAQDAADKLGIRNISFRRQDLRDWRPDFTLAGAYALDVFHHLPIESGNRLLEDLSTRLRPGGRFLLKDIDTTPRAMLWFTNLLDLLMSPRDDFFYRSAGAWRGRLRESGFGPIHLHHLWDILPYPHILLIAEKPRTPARVEAREGAG